MAQIPQIVRLGGVEGGHKVAQVLRQGVGVVCGHKDPGEILVSFKNPSEGFAEKAK